VQLESGRNIPFRAGFNPHRLLGVGATPNLCELTEHPVVSILTDSWEPVQRQGAEKVTPGRIVSILTDSWEPVQHGPPLMGQ